jgi:opacity protein-like surface antigen
MKKLFISGIAVLMLIAFSNVKAQKGFSIHVGGAIPIGAFAESPAGLYLIDVAGDEGEASVGFNIGAKYLYEFKLEGLGAFVNMDYNQNGMKKDFKDDVEEYYEDEDNPEFKFPKYLNIPILVGAQYTYKINEIVGVYGNLGLGVDILKMTKLTMESTDVEINWEFDTPAAFAYRLGFGTVLKDKFIIDLNFNFLGNHDTQLKYISDDEELIEIDLNRKVNIMNLTVGYKF